MRSRLQRDLADLEIRVLELGELVEHMVGEATRALVSRDCHLARRVVAGDDDIDRRYLDIDARVIDALVTQAPVATDLRLLSVILHINPHLERIGDQAVNVAKMALAASELRPNSTIIAHLSEMSELVREMLRVVMEAFARRDLGACLRLPDMDDPVDALNRQMIGQVTSLAGDEAALEWGIMMCVTSRHLERVGDNAVDIAEQVAFLLTGEFREFTDASH